MAEVSNLLGLITDEETRVRLIAQMEQMFDSAEDEEKLIEQIGSPTKVAVALIRYADKKRAANAPAEPAPAEEPAAPVTEMIEQAEANAEAPEQAPMPELAFEEAEEPVVEAEPELEVAEILLPAEEAAAEIVETEPAEEVLEPAGEFVEAELFVEEVVPVEEPVEEAVEAVEEAVEEFVEAEPEAYPAAASVDEELARAVEAGAAEAFCEVPVDELPPEEAAAAEEAAFLAEEAAVIGDAAVSEEEAAADALTEELFAEEEPAEVEYRTVKNGGKAFLYFLIPGLVPGLPVFLVLFVLSLVFLAVGVAAIAAAVSVFMSAFVGFNVVADMLLLIGAGTSLFAIALVFMWFAIWFLTKVCFGWVRLMHRGGVRFSRKEVPVE